MKGYIFIFFPMVAERRFLVLDPNNLNFNYVDHLFPIGCSSGEKLQFLNLEVSCTVVKIELPHLGCKKLT